MIITCFWFKFMSIFKSLFSKEQKLTEKSTNQTTNIDLNKQTLDDPPPYYDSKKEPSIDLKEKPSIKISKSHLKNISDNSIKNGLTELEIKLYDVLYNVIENMSETVLFGFVIDASIDNYTFKFITADETYGYETRVSLIIVTVKDEFIQSNLSAKIIAVMKPVTSLCYDTHHTCYKKHKYTNLKMRTVYAKLMSFKWIKDDMLIKKYNEVCSKIFTPEFVSKIYDELNDVASLGAYNYEFKINNAFILRDYLVLNKIFADITITGSTSGLIFSWD
jgi:hypothetical protein